ncbi:alpha/beta fold hydrolase [Roseobacter sinensis]|uniref:Alpha/beta hydrolase n=1 Tax=Roseobacter sinensis TaxID=2931391 RepID=A0ABT3B9U4_9RHOB|nr:alpha/beta hydrolase [Roseobacter sp. WL0113]MCV3270320.1 alpha/beta hydrolase [Roseobacter sp. WL0113]
MTQTDPSALIYDADAVAQAERLVICAPGALTRIEIFDPVLTWRSAGWEPVFYPFPGLDGRPLSPPLDIVQAAGQIVAFARAYPHRQIGLLGFSTGGAIVIEAAALLGDAVRTVAIAPGLPGAGGWRTMLGTTRDVLGVAWRVRSLRVRPVWLEYYRILLFGRAVLQHVDTREKSRQFTEARAARMVYPENGLLRAHAGGLKRWLGPKTPVPKPESVTLLIGDEDSVFSTNQTRAFAATLGEVPLRRFPGHAHMLILTEPAIFDTARAIFEGRDPERSGLSD